MQEKQSLFFLDLNTKNYYVKHEFQDQGKENDMSIKSGDKNKVKFLKQLKEYKNSYADIKLQLSTRSSWHLVQRS